MLTNVPEKIKMQLESKKFSTKFHWLLSWLVIVVINTATFAVTTFAITIQTK